MACASGGRLSDDRIHTSCPRVRSSWPSPRPGDQRRFRRRDAVCHEAAWGTFRWARRALCLGGRCTRAVAPDSRPVAAGHSKGWRVAGGYHIESHRSGCASRVPGGGAIRCINGGVGPPCPNRRRLLCRVPTGAHPVAGEVARGRHAAGRPMARSRWGASLYPLQTGTPPFLRFGLGTGSAWDP